MSDTDAMLIFERMKSADGGIDITTVCDPDKGAKVRGLYQPVSFHLAPDRSVSLCADVVPVPDYSKDAAKRGKLSEEEIQDCIRDYLQDQPEPVPQKQIIDDLKGEPGITYHPLRKALLACAVPEFANMPAGQIYIRTEYAFNRKTYGVSR